MRFNGNFEKTNLQISFSELEHITKNGKDYGSPILIKKGILAFKRQNKPFKWIFL